MVRRAVVSAGKAAIPCAACHAHGALLERPSSSLGLYAGFGAAQAFFNFLATLTFYYAGLYASLHLFRGAFRGVLWSPMAFHDVTPVGRIISRLS